VTGCLSSGQIYAHARYRRITDAPVLPQTALQECLSLFGKVRDYLRFWLTSLGITILSFALFTLTGSLRWNYSGKVFLDQLAWQFAANILHYLVTVPGVALLYFRKKLNVIPEFLSEMSR